MAEVYLSKKMLHFLVASYAPKIIALLRDDPTARAVLGDAIADKIKAYPKAEEAKAKPAQEILADERAVMQAFVAAIYPKDMAVNQTTLNFICKSYLTHRHNDKPILAEDFYKVADNLAYFEGLKNNGVLRAQNISGDLLSYKTYQDFLDMLKPFDDKRMAKEAADAFRKMTPAQKEIIKGETTILYDGPEGQVVIPHTPRASQYWGSNTKWCISGSEYADKYFPTYNSKSPIVMILPKGMHDQKIALVDQTLWNAEDNKVNDLPEAHYNLFQKMLASHPADIAADIKTLIKPEQCKIASTANADKKEPIPDEWQSAIVKMVIDTKAERTKSSLPEDLLNNKKFMLYAIKHDYHALQYASDSLKNDPEFILSAVKIRGACIQYASKDVQNNHDVALAAIEKFYFAISYIPYELRIDPEFLMKAVKRNTWIISHLSDECTSNPVIILEGIKQSGRILQYASPELKADRAVVMAAVTQDGYALQYASHELKADR